MPSNKKTLITILIAVILVAIVFGLVYYFFFMKGGVGEPEITPDLPIGSNGQPALPSSGISTSTTGAGTKVNIPRLRQITVEPIGGAGIFGNVIRYIERADG